MKRIKLELVRVDGAACSQVHLFSTAYVPVNTSKVQFTKKNNLNPIHCWRPEFGYQRTKYAIEKKKSLYRGRIPPPQDAVMKQG